MSNLVAGPAVPPTELIVGQKYEIRFSGRRINSGTYKGPHETSPGFLFFLVDNPKNTKQVVSVTHTFHPLMPPKSVTEQRKLEQMYRQDVGLPANVLGLVGEFTNAKNPYDLYKAETTGTGTGVSLPRGGRKTRTRKTRKRKTRRQRR
jgi:hypothetical protein